MYIYIYKFTRSFEKKSRLQQIISSTRSAQETVITLDERRANVDLFVRIDNEAANEQTVGVVGGGQRGRASGCCREKSPRRFGRDGQAISVCHSRSRSHSECGERFARGAAS